MSHRATYLLSREKQTNKVQAPGLGPHHVLTFGVLGGTSGSPVPGVVQRLIPRLTSFPPPQPLPPQVSAFPRPAKKDHVPGECGVSLYCALFYRRFQVAHKNASNNTKCKRIRIRENRKRMEDQSRGKGGADSLQRLLGLLAAL